MTRRLLDCSSKRDPTPVCVNNFFSYFDLLVVVYRDSDPRVRKTWHHVFNHLSCLHLSPNLLRVDNLFRFGSDAPAGDILLGYGVTYFDGAMDGERGVRLSSFPSRFPSGPDTLHCSSILSLRPHFGQVILIFDICPAKCPERPLGVCLPRSLSHGVRSRSPPFRSDLRQHPLLGTSCRRNINVPGRVQEQE